MLNDARRGRRIQDSVPRRLRRVPVRDGRVRRPRAARHDLSRAPRRDVACSTGRSPSSTGRPIRSAYPVLPPDRRVQAVPGRAGRARVAAASSRRSRNAGRLAQVHATIPTSSCASRRAPGIGFLAGWRGEDGNEPLRGRAEPEAVGDVREEQLRSSRTTCRDALQYMRNWNQRYLEFAQDVGCIGARRADRHADLVGAAAELPARGAGQATRAASRRDRSCASASRRISIRCRSGTRRSRPRRPMARRYPLSRDHAAADGDVPLVGFAERVAAADPLPTTTCT